MYFDHEGRSYMLRFSHNSKEGSSFATLFFFSDDGAPLPTELASASSTKHPDDSNFSRPVGRELCLNRLVSSLEPALRNIILHLYYSRKPQRHLSQRPPWLVTTLATIRHDWRAAGESKADYHARRQARESRRAAS